MYAPNPSGDSACARGDAARRDRPALHLLSAFGSNEDPADDGFMGAWSLDGAAEVVVAPRALDGSICLQGRGWVLCAPRSRYRGEDRTKVHLAHDGRAALAFRGYLLEPPLHHFSPPEALLEYWQDKAPADRRRNGVFARASVDLVRNRLVLSTDAFGFSPLYYRVCEEHVLFATRADLLLLPDTESDPIAMASVLANGFIVGDRSLHRGIQRVPYGREIHFDCTPTPRTRAWFCFDDLPAAETPLDDDAVTRVENALCRAMDRCRALDYGPWFLPFSSGHDSRRILGALLDAELRFDAATVRFPQKGHLDLDAHFACAMASHFRFPHRVLELRAPADYAEDDAIRRARTSAETPMHTWAVTLMRAAGPEATALLDGFLGDVLGNPGYRLPGLYAEPSRDIARVADMVATIPHRRYLSPALDVAEAIRQEVIDYLRPLADRRNVAEFAFDLLRQRRATALWSQQLVPAQHLVLCPFLDLDYMCAAISIRPEDRHARPLQRECLQRFHPALASFPGSRAVPPGIRPSAAHLSRALEQACVRRMWQDTPRDARRSAWRRDTSPAGRCLLSLSRMRPELVWRWEWVVQPALEVLGHTARLAPVWRRDA